MLTKGPEVTQPPPVPWGTTGSKGVSVSGGGGIWPRTQHRKDLDNEVVLGDLGRLTNFTRGVEIEDKHILIGIIQRRAITRQGRCRAVKELRVGEPFLLGFCPVPVGHRAGISAFVTEGLFHGPGEPAVPTEEVCLLGRRKV